MFGKTKCSQRELSDAVKERLRHDSCDSLFTATTCNLVHVVERVLLSGAVSANAVNSHGATALHIAAMLGFSDLCKLLHDFGATTNLLWDGSSPLHLAVSENHADMVAVLLGVGAQIDLRDSFGFTPLHIAAIRGNRSLAMFLIQRGADPALRDGDGMTVAERWNFAAQSPSVHQQEQAQSPSASGPPERVAALSDPALLRVFRSFDSYVEEKRLEAVTPTFYRLQYDRFVNLSELESYLKSKVDPCGLPPIAVEKKIDGMLASAKRKSLKQDGRVNFDDFALIWLKAQTSGLL